MDEHGCISAIIDDLIGSRSIRPSDGFEGAIPIFFEGFAFPSEYRNTRGGYRGGGMVLSGKNVARAPTYIRSKIHQGFDQNCRLNRHMQRPHDLNASEGFGWSVLFTGCHQAGHFMLGNGNFLSTELS